MIGASEKTGNNFSVTVSFYLSRCTKTCNWLAIPSATLFTTINLPSKSFSHALEPIFPHCIFPAHLKLQEFLGFRDPTSFGMHSKLMRHGTLRKGQKLQQYTSDSTSLRQYGASSVKFDSFGDFGCVFAWTESNQPWKGHSWTVGLEGKISYSKAIKKNDALFESIWIVLVCMYICMRVCMYEYIPMVRNFFFSQNFTSYSKLGFSISNAYKKNTYLKFNNSKMTLFISTKMLMMAFWWFYYLINSVYFQKLRPEPFLTVN